MKTVEYEKITYEQYESISEEYTYWIKNCSSKRECSYYESEYTYFNSHCSSAHTEWVIYDCPHNSTWEEQEVAHVIAKPVPAQVEDDGIICFDSHNEKVQQLVKSGVAAIEVEEAAYEVECHHRVNKIRHCGSYEEYTTLVRQYEEYTSHYESTHKGVHHHESVPAWKDCDNGQSGNVQAQPHVAVCH